MADEGTGRAGELGKKAPMCVLSKMLLFLHVQTSLGDTLHEYLENVGITYSEN